MSDSVADLIPEETLHGYDRLRADCGLLADAGVRILEIRGEDRKGWLQGQATNDVKQLDVGASYAFCLCSPTGQIVAVCDIWGLPERFIVTCDPISRDGLLQRVEQMVILEDVTARDITDELVLLSVQGPNATRGLSELLELPTLDAAVDGERTYLRSNRTGLGGWDVLLPKSEKKLIENIRKSFVEVDAHAYDIARLEAGIPRVGVDIDAKTMPPELGPVFEARHVSYKKGCYTGQEVLMRIHSRGHTNRTWVALFSREELRAGDSVMFGKRGAVGTITSATFSPDYGYIAAAMVRNEVVLEGETVLVNGHEAELRHMPILRFD